MFYYEAVWLLLSLLNYCKNRYNNFICILYFNVEKAFRKSLDEVPIETVDNSMYQLFNSEVLLSFIFIISNYIILNNMN